MGSLPIVPESADESPNKIDIRVDFPAPFRPSKACTRPGVTESETSLRTRWFPNDLVTRDKLSDEDMKEVCRRSFFPVSPSRTNLGRKFSYCSRTFWPSNTKATRSLACSFDMSEETCVFTVVSARTSSWAISRLVAPLVISRSTSNSRRVTNASPCLCAADSSARPAIAAR